MFRSSSSISVLGALFACACTFGEFSVSESTGPETMDADMSTSHGSSMGAGGSRDGSNGAGGGPGGGGAGARRSSDASSFGGSSGGSLAEAGTTDAPADTSVVIGDPGTKGDGDITLMPPYTAHPDV